MVALQGTSGNSVVKSGPQASLFPGGICPRQHSVMWAQALSAVPSIGRMSSRRAGRPPPDRNRKASKSRGRPSGLSGARGLDAAGQISQATISTRTSSGSAKNTKQQPHPMGNRTYGLGT